MNSINWSVTYYVINSADELNELCKNTSYGADDFEKYVDFATQTIIVFVSSATVPIVSVELCWAKVFNLIGYVGRIGDNIFVKWNGYMFFIYQQPASGVCPLVIYQPVQLPPPYYNAIITHKKIYSRSLIVKYVDSILYIGGSLDIDKGFVGIYNIDRLLEDYCSASPESRVLPEECVICLRKMRESGGLPSDCTMELKDHKISQDNCPLSSEIPECTTCKNKLVELEKMKKYGGYPAGEKMENIGVVMME